LRREGKEGKKRGLVGDSGESYKSSDLSPGAQTAIGLDSEVSV
jgi:hypothetical protein